MFYIIISSIYFTILPNIPPQKISNTEKWYLNIFP